MNEKVKQEAIKRMKRLGIHSETIKAFEEKGEIKLSLNGKIENLPSRYRRPIKKWEKDTRSVVYHAVFSNTVFGKMLALLYVREEYEDEWEIDLQEIADGYPTVCVLNLTNPMLSEYGTIGIEEVNGGLVRIA